MSKIEEIVVKGAKVNNLKDVSVSIPTHKLTVITGLSGSGKSSLAFDVLFAEGQRRYVESLSAYARQFLGRIVKPNVDSIQGLSPAIAIEQKTNTRNTRSTVGTVTEIYDFLKLLFAKIGKTFSPISGKLVSRHSSNDVWNYIVSQAENSTIYLLCPLLIRGNNNVKDQLSILQQQGYSRIFHKNKIIRIDDFIDFNQTTTISKTITDELFLLIDRLRLNTNDDMLRQRIIASIETAFSEGDGKCIVFSESDNKFEIFSEYFEQDGISFEEPTINFFSFNNPYGACKTCGGFGNVMGIDPDLVIPNKNLSVYEGAITCWKGEKMSEYLRHFLDVAYKFNFPIHRPWNELTDTQQKLLWTGNKYFEGLDDFFKMLQANTYKIQYRVMLSRFKSKITCPDCKGTRLRKDASYVKIAGMSITEMLLMSISDLQKVFKKLDINDYEKTIAKHILFEINSRLSYLVDTGLSYLTLNRLSNTLSGGETQRINLARALGSSLVGSMYILDEPSIGLHPKDTDKLITVLKKLRDLKNTLIIVEHDEDIIKAADYIIDLGPDAGSNGGKLIYQGNFNDLLKVNDSHTAKYFNHIETIEPNLSPRKQRYFIELSGCRQHNLKNIDIKIPLGLFTVVTGVSGSGKSTLVRHVLYPALKNYFGDTVDQIGDYDNIGGDLKLISGVEIVDQNPIGRSSRSNPATYVKAFDDIRELLANQPLAIQRGYKPGFFSFNVEGGRCEACQGEGVITVEMQFMADVHLVCEECKGNKFKDETLDIKYNDKSIVDILNMTIDEAVDFFKTSPEITNKNDRICNKIYDKLKPLQDVGLGYLQMGQSSSTLSGGEAQRIKLGYFLQKGNEQRKMLFIFDEPTTGLHYFDIKRLKTALDSLIAAGHTIIVVEHNMELIKCADYIIDLGPEGGQNGGNVVYQGSLIEMKNIKDSATSQFLIDKMK